jgi:hypothetical protein
MYKAFWFSTEAGAYWSVVDEESYEAVELARTVGELAADTAWLTLPAGSCAGSPRSVPLPIMLWNWTSSSFTPTTARSRSCGPGNCSKRAAHPPRLFVAKAKIETTSGRALVESAATSNGRPSDRLQRDIAGCCRT